LPFHSKLCFSLIVRANGPLIYSIRPLIAEIGDVRTWFENKRPDMQPFNPVPDIQDVLLDQFSYILLKKRLINIIQTISMTSFHYPGAKKVTLRRFNNTLLVNIGC